MNLCFNQAYDYEIRELMLNYRYTMVEYSSKCMNPHNHLSKLVLMALCITLRWNEKFDFPTMLAHDWDWKEYLKLVEMQILLLVEHT